MTRAGEDVSGRAEYRIAVVNSTDHAGYQEKPSRLTALVHWRERFGP